jgi:hypothetical protein
MFSNRASSQWQEGLAKAKHAKPDQFTDETYARAQVACMPANMPDFARADSEFNSLL